MAWYGNNNSQLLHGLSKVLLDSPNKYDGYKQAFSGLNEASKIVEDRHRLNLERETDSQIESLLSEEVDPSNPYGNVEKALSMSGSASKGMRESLNSLLGLTTAKQSQANADRTYGIQEQQLQNQITKENNDQLNADRLFGLKEQEFKETQKQNSIDNQLEQMRILASNTGKTKDISNDLIGTSDEMFGIIKDKPSVANSNTKTTFNKDGTLTMDSFSTGTMNEKALKESNVYQQLNIFKDNVKEATGKPFTAENIYKYAYDKESIDTIFALEGDVAWRKVLGVGYDSEKAKRQIQVLLNVQNDLGNMSQADAEVALEIMKPAFDYLEEGRLDKFSEYMGGEDWDSQNPAGVFKDRINQAKLSNSNIANEIKTYNKEISDFNKELFSVKKQLDLALKSGKIDSNYYTNAMQQLQGEKESALNQIFDSHSNLKALIEG